MKTPLYRIPGPWTGWVATAPRPRGGDWLEDELAAWRAAGAALVVSTLTTGETVHLALETEDAACRAVGLELLRFPIPDCEIPPSSAALTSFLARLETRLTGGDGIAIHCRMGIGRSSTLAACLLVRAGIAVDEAFQRIAAARGCAVPDTPAQRAWVEAYARDLTARSR